jgi:hypothetical protein
MRVKVNKLLIAPKKNLKCAIKNYYNDKQA